MAKPTYAKDKNDLPLYTDKIGMERLEIIAGNILDSAKRVYTYDSANDVLLDDAMPPNQCRTASSWLKSQGSVSRCCN
jgi:hypothetical protein